MKCDIIIYFTSCTFIAQFVRFFKEGVVNEWDDMACKQVVSLMELLESIILKTNLHLHLFLSWDH